MDNLGRRQLSFSQYLDILRAKWLVVLFVTLAVTGAATLYSFRQTPTYTAQARILVSPLPVPGSVQTLNTNTERERLASVPVALKVAEDLDSEASPEQLLNQLSVTAIEETEVLVASFTSASPAAAARTANSFAANYLDLRREEAAERYEEAAEAIEARLQVIDGLLEENSTDLKSASIFDAGGTRLSLESERRALEARRSQLLARLDELDAPAFTATDGGEVIQPATEPSEPSSPNLKKDVLAGLLAGLALAVAAALIMERLEDRFHSRDEVETALQAPVLGSVPKYQTPQRTSPNSALLADPTSPQSEAYRSLRTAVDFVARRDGVRSFLITSPSPGEGKTVTALNLAVAFAQVGRSVALVSADMRRPTLDDQLGIKSNTGLSTFLSTSTDVSNLLVPSEVAGLVVLPAGALPVNPAELLASPRLGSLVSRLEADFEVTIFDSPPTLPAADASILAGLTGAAVIVVNGGTTHPPELVRAREDLARSGGRIIGGVLNALDPRMFKTYYGSYYAATYPPLGDVDRPPATETSEPTATRAPLKRKSHTKRTTRKTPAAKVSSPSKPISLVAEMFDGKKLRDLTTEERQAYNRELRSRRSERKG